MRSDVVRIFDAHLAKVFKKREDLRKFFLKHERKNKCIDNLCEQIEICERRSYSFTFDAAVYKKTIESVAGMFAETCLKHAEYQATSSIEKIRQQTAADQEKQIEAMFEQMKKDGELQDTTTTKELGADNGPSQETDRGS